ncbi:MAG: cytochrome b/b6 domain-containing protein [Gammaproteobacteria bacterium]|jgi:cytochrome b|nr:cytochrome b/b6 domain-containing protein [Gammaproteobacteria bacterium]
MIATENTVKIWDPIVRIGHWTLVLAFFIAYFTEDDFLTQHVWAGYVVGAVVLVRLIWGFVGSKHARFRDFVRSPSGTLGYMRDLTRGSARRYLGHNPAGGAMVVAHLLCITVTVFSGLMLYAVEENAGPLAGWAANAPTSYTIQAPISSAYADEDEENEVDENAAEEFWEEIHELFANLVLLLAGLHVAGVLLSGYLHKENLIRAMVTGRKRPESK